MQIDPRLQRLQNLIEQKQALNAQVQRQENVRSSAQNGPSFAEAAKRAQALLSQNSVKKSSALRNTEKVQQTFDTNRINKAKNTPKPDIDWLTTARTSRILNDRETGASSTGISKSLGVKIDTYA